MSVPLRASEATVWAGNLDPMVTEELLHELFNQAGPVHKVSIPKDKVSGLRHNFGFIEYEQPTDADYACKIMSNVKLFNKPIKLSRSANQKATLDQSFHAKLFIGNLDQSVDEHTLYELFVQFGAVLSAKVMTESDSDTSRGFGFVQFDSFDSADAAIAAMDGQYVGNRPIHVNYAFKPNSKGERHGTEEERELERQSREAMGSVPVRPPTMISTTVPPLPPMPQATHVNQPIRLSLNTSQQPVQQQTPAFVTPMMPPGFGANTFPSQIPLPPAYPSISVVAPPGFAVPAPPGYPPR